jgi:hypothetical protein
MTLTDLDEFVRTKVSVVEGKPDTSIGFSSGGIDQDVWCDRKEKAIELWCYEFSNYIKDKKTIRFEEKPTMYERLFFSKTTSNYMDPVKLFTVWAMFDVAP